MHVKNRCGIVRQHSRGPQVVTDVVTARLQLGGEPTVRTPALPDFVLAAAAPAGAREGRIRHGSDDTWPALDLDSHSARACS